MGSNLLRCALQQLLVLLAQAKQCQYGPSSVLSQYKLMVDVILGKLREVLAAPGTECGQ